MDMNIDLYLGAPLGMAGGGSASYNCWNPPGTNADWIGYRFADTAYGSLKEVYTSSGTFIYAFELNKTTGEARIIFSDDDGATPGYQEPNTTILGIQAKQFGNLELSWNASEGYYQDFNMELANALFEYHNANPLESVCFNAIAVSRLLIHYSLSAIEEAV